MVVNRMANLDENMEHSFATYVRTLGRGPARSRHLTFDEGRDAFRMILNGEVEGEQLGAFLLLLRYRTENADEVAGFVQACRDYYELEGVGRPGLLDWLWLAGLG